MIAVRFHQLCVPRKLDAPEETRMGEYTSQIWKERKLGEGGEPLGRSGRSASRMRSEGVGPRPAPSISAEKEGDQGPLHAGDGNAAPAEIRTIRSVSRGPPRDQQLRGINGGSFCGGASARSAVEGGRTEQGPRNRVTLDATRP